ncbi:MAG: cytochrome P460 family protein [Halopseudomonas sp.]
MKLISLFAAIICSLITTAVQAGPENVAWPGDYKQSLSHYYSGDRTANGKQIIRAYANKAAMAGKQADGNFPYGSVVVGELYVAKLNDKEEAIISSLGRRIVDKMAAIVVMQRGEGFDEQYPDALKVGDWEFAVFSPDGKRLDKDVTGCRTCHHPLSERGFLFSDEHLGQ